MELWLLPRRPFAVRNSVSQCGYGGMLWHVMAVWASNTGGIISVVQLERQVPTRECACAVNRRRDISFLHMSKYWIC